MWEEFYFESIVAVNTIAIADVTINFAIQAIMSCVAKNLISSIFYLDFKVTNSFKLNHHLFR
jgi:hypothetical protein